MSHPPTPLRLVEQTERRFACTVCGARFERRFIASDGVMSLEEHWATTPECGSNRYATGSPQRFPSAGNDVEGE